MLPAVTHGIPACKKHSSVIVLSIIAIIFICVWRGWGRGLRDFAREFQKNVDSYEDDDATIPVTVCLHERPGLAAVGWGEHTMKEGVRRGAPTGGTI